jgi:DNA repair protein RadC
MKKYRKPPVSYEGLPRLHLVYEGTTRPYQYVHNHNDAAAVLRPFFTGIEHREEMHALYINNAGRVLGTYLVSSGGVDSTAVDVRLVLQPALLSNASGIILAHNHPSGAREASREDHAVTRMVRDAAKLMNMQLTDHIILMPDNTHISFMQEDWL